MILNNTISPYREMLAYEALWSQKGSSEKIIADFFKVYSNKLPSQVLKFFLDSNEKKYNTEVKNVEDKIKTRINGFSVSVYGDFQYPEKLRDSKYPPELLYYVGNYELINTKSVSIVGSRDLSEKGAAKARKISKAMVDEGYTIVSGLAKGIDTNVHEACIAHGGKTIGVIGTPIDKYYPKENKKLQDKIKHSHLLVSQVPLYRYFVQNPKSNRYFFPMRNKTMAAISNGTIIIEAGESSGTLTQARACIQQKRKLFILDSLFHNNSLSWPTYYQKLGAIRVKSIDEILSRLE